MILIAGMGFLIMCRDGQIQEERPDLACWVYPLHVWALLPLGNWNLRIADEAVTTTKTAQSVSQDIVLRVLRGAFAEKNVVVPGVAQANAMHMLQIFQATSIFLWMGILTCSNWQKADTEEIRP